MRCCNHSDLYSDMHTLQKYSQPYSVSYLAYPTSKVTFQVTLPIVSMTTELASGIPFASIFIMQFNRPRNKWVRCIFVYKSRRFISPEARRLHRLVTVGDLPATIPSSSIKYTWQTLPFSIKSKQMITPETHSAFRKVIRCSCRHTLTF